MIRAGHEYKYVGRMGLAYYNSVVVVVATDRQKQKSDIRFPNGHTLLVPNTHLKEK